MKSVAESKVVIVRGPGVLPRRGEVHPAILSRMYDRGFQILTGQKDAAEGLRSIFAPSDRVGIKINTIAAPELTTPPAVSLPLARRLAAIGIREKNIVIWDRTNRELKSAGYKLTNGTADIQVFGTDTAGAGYGNEPAVHRDIASLFSRVQTDFVTASVSLAILKDHGLAGVTGAMKNYFGAVHNPNKYHDDGCDPFVADLFDAPPIKSKNRLAILDALVVQVHRGPSFHAAWAETAERLVFSLDPVAADAVGWRLIERFRQGKGLPSLTEEGRPPRYILTAAGMGLGHAAEAEIRVIEEEV